MTDIEQERIKAICKVAHIDDISDLSDGYHTFKQLYYQRLMLFAALVKQNRDKSWKSLRHEDGELCFGGGWFIVGIDTPEGSYTYHYEDNYFSLFDCVELERGKKWDGHTEKDVTRLLSLDQEPCDDMSILQHRSYLEGFHEALKLVKQELKSQGDVVELSKIKAIQELVNESFYQGFMDGKEEGIRETKQEPCEELDFVQPHKKVPVNLVVCKMRDATQSERDGVERYIDSIAEPKQTDVPDTNVGEFEDTELVNVKQELLDRGDEMVSFRQLVERFEKIEEVYKGIPWTLKQIYANFNILIGEKPCTDAINRQAVLDAMRKNHRSGGRDIDGDYIEGDYRECLYDDIISLPPVTPAENPNKWIPTNKKLSNNDADLCNNCPCKTDTCQEGLHCPMDE